MKLSCAIFLSSLLGASAFAPSHPKATASVLRMSEDNVDMTSVSAATDAGAAAVEIPDEPIAPTRSLPTKSQALPFMDRPALLDGTMPGDAGFDPLGFAKTPSDLASYREAEIKHGRLAMLAAAGWPLSELLDRKIANLLNLPVILDSSDRAPSVLNGGLDKISPIYWVSVLVAAAAIDAYGINRSKQADPNYFPGNLGFDPLGLYPKDEAGQFRMQTTEVKNGRLAMLGITGFAFAEFVQKMGVVAETPAFFKPIGQVLADYTNSGYYTPN